MDDISEAGLDLELRAFGRRLDRLLMARGWNPKATASGRDRFELRTSRLAEGRMRIVLDASLPEAAAREIVALALATGAPGDPTEAKIKP